MTKSEEAHNLFLSGYNCAQSVFAAFAEDLGMDKQTALKVSCGFGGGMGRLQETCGALTGAIMALGMKYGKFRAEHDDAREQTYTLVRKCNDAFKEKIGSNNCRSITGCDFLAEEGWAKFKAGNLHATVCAGCVKEAVEIVEQELG